MPNHVKSIITIKGEASEVKKFLEEVNNHNDVDLHEDDDAKKDFDFNKIIPRPKSLDIESGASTQLAIAAYLLHSEEDSSFNVANVFKKLQNEPQELLNALAKNLSSLVNKVSPDLPNIIINCNKFIQKISSSSYMEKEKLLELGKKTYENICKYGFANWYEWSIENWGTKWNCYKTKSCFVAQGDTGEAKIEFFTAWSAPFPVFEKMIQKYPNLNFKGKFADEDFGYNCGEWVAEEEEIAVTTPKPGGKLAIKLSEQIWSE